MPNPTPYYQDKLVTLYHGDCREIMPYLAPVDAIITDPVWPNVKPGMLPGSDAPHDLFKTAAAHFPRLAERLVVHLGIDSDPRFLQHIPACYDFLRVCWLEYAFPHPKGRILYSGDVAYAYGTAPPARKRQKLLAGKTISTSNAKRPAGHPCPRKLEHAKWLVYWYARGPVLDPFAGIGTTLVAAMELGLPSIGIEVKEAYCARTVERLQARYTQMELFEPGEVLEAV